jgi:fibronectin-binding autotransporter adhesin
VRIVPPLGVVICTAFLLNAVPRGHAQNFWDIDSATAGLGGTGNWDLATPNWTANPAGTGPNFVWPNTVTSDATFTGTAGTVTLTIAGIQVRNMNFAVNGYTIAGANTLTLAGAPSAIRVENAADTAVISAPLGGGGFTKLGLGTLTLIGASDFGTSAVGVERGTVVLLGSTLKSGDGNLGEAAGADGTFRMDGGSVWTLNGMLAVGGFGAGTLIVQGNADLVSFAGASIGREAGSSGSVTVTGAGSTWTNSNGVLSVGRFGSGSLTIQSGGVVSGVVGIINDEGGTGTALVDGIGSAWTNTGDLTVGDEDLGGPGTGTLTIQNGGAVSTGGMLTVGRFGTGIVTIQTGGNLLSTSGGRLGTELGSSGSVTVTGAGSTWTNTNGVLSVGFFGSGALTIQSGGVVSSVVGIINDEGGTGTVLVDGIGSAWTNTADLTVGDEDLGGPGTGTLTIQNGGAVSAVGMLTVGRFGKGIVTIQTGGDLSNGVAVLGDLAGSSGSVTVTGAGSTWTMAGDFTVGSEGTGVLNILNGAAVSNNAAVIADGPTGIGTVRVDGGSWINSGDLTVGNRGMGALDIKNGGMVSSVVGRIGGSTFGVATVESGASWTNSAGLIVGGFGTATLDIRTGGMVSVTGFGAIGAVADSIGTATVDGGGSTWTMTGNLRVGADGTGALNILHGGMVSDNFGLIGVEVTGIGTATVDGLGSTWTNTGDLTVGFRGNGALTIRNGGAVSNVNAIIGDVAGSNGIATLDGPTSTWTITGALTVGNFGAGTLNIQNGATFSTAIGFLGFNPNSSGTVAALSGATWNNASPLFVGGDGAGPKGNGVLRIASATVNTGPVTVWSTGALEIGINPVLNTPLLTFNGGTLRTIADTTFSNDAVLGTNQGNGVIVDSAGLISTLSGVFSGPGGLTKINAGTIILSGVNTNTGDTNINAGSLIVDGSIASANTFVNAGGTIGGSGTIGGNLTIADDGILAPGNSAGTITVLGSLALSNASLLNYELGTPGVINSGINDLTVVGGNLTLDGILSTTALADFGPGAYRLFNYGGALTDNILEIGTVPAGFSASNFMIVTGLPNEVDLLVLAGPLAALTQFWDGPNLAPNGVIDGGTGSWDNVSTNWTDAAGAANSSWQNGVAVFAGSAGTVTITQPIFFSGMEFMSDGYAINATAPFGLNLIDSPTITTDPGVTATINAPISGAGGMTKEGGGTLVLAGANDYSGDTNVNGGSLIVEGSIASINTFVNPSGLLGGTGIIGGNVSNAGVVSPGISPGTLTISSNYTQSGAGTLRIEIAGLAPAEHDLLAIGGSAALDGTVQLVRLNNFSLDLGERVVFLTAGAGVNGTFATADGLAAFFSNGTILQPAVVYGPNEVSLELVRGSFAGLPGLTPNQQAVANTLDRVVNDPAADALIGFLDSELIEFLPNDFDLIAPEELTAMFEIGLSTANVQGYNIENRLEEIRNGSNGFRSTLQVTDSKGARDLSSSGKEVIDHKGGKSVIEQATGPASPENRWGFFVSGLGEFVSVDGDFNSSGYDFQTGGVTLGLDYRLTGNFALGLTAGYAHTNADLVNGGDIDVDSGKIGLYATWFSGGAYINGLVEGGFTNYDTRRSALLGFANGETDGAEFNGLLGGGYDFKCGKLTFGPTASIQYTTVNIDRFTESGSLAPLSIDDQDEDAFRSRLGGRLSCQWQTGNVIVRPEVRAEWKHEFSDEALAIDSSFAGISNSNFTVHGPRRGEDSAVVGAGLNVQWSPAVLTFLNYQAELGRENYEQQSVTGGVRVNF